MKTIYTLFCTPLRDPKTAEDVVIKLYALWQEDGGLLMDGNLGRVWEAGYDWNWTKQRDTNRKAIQTELAPPSFCPLMEVSRLDVYQV